MTKKIEVVLSAVDKTPAAIASAKKGLESIAPAASIASAALSRFGIGIPVSLAAIAGGALTAANNTAAAAREVKNFAELSGTGAEEFTALAYAADRVGISQEKLADIFKDVQDKVGDFVQNGSGPLKDFFDNIAPRVGVTADQFRRLSGPEALQLYVSSLEKANLSQSDLVFYMEAIASDSARLLPLLRNNGAEFSNLSDEARRLGVTMQDEAVAKAVEFGDNLKKLQGMTKALSMDIGNALIPTVSRLAEEFLLGMQHADGFFDALMKYGLSNPFSSVEGNLERVRAEYESLDFVLSNGRSKDEEADREKLRQLGQQLAYYQALNKARSGESAPEVKPPAVGGPLSSSGSSRKKTKTATYTDPLADEAKAYAQAMQQIHSAQVAASTSGMQLTTTQQRLVELVNDPAFATWPEQWQLTVLEAGKYAVAAEQAADEQKRLNELLGDTDSSKIAAARYDMELLTQAYEQGKISEQKYIESTSARLDDFQGGSRDTLQRTGEYAQDFFGGLSRALTDFNGDVGESFKRTVLGMIQKVMQLEMEMAMMAAYKGGGGSSGGGIFGLIGSFVGSLFGGGGGIDTSFTSGMGSAASMNMGNFDWTFSKNGNVFSGSPSLHAFANTVQTTPTPFVFDQRQAFAKGGVFAEAGPEAVMPLRRDASGRLGVYAQAAPQAAPKVEVVVNNLGTPQTYQQTESRMSDGRTQITLTAADVYQRGELAQALEATYPMLQRIGT